MKKSEIKIGGIYTNGKGRIRQVLDRTNDGKYRLYSCIRKLETTITVYEWRTTNY